MVFVCDNVTKSWYHSAIVISACSAQIKLHLATTPVCGKLLIEKCVMHIMTGYFTCVGRVAGRESG